MTKTLTINIAKSILKCSPTSSIFLSSILATVPITLNASLYLSDMKVIVLSGIMQFPSVKVKT